MKKRSYTRPYVGLLPDGTREVFRYAGTPTNETHGARYAAVIGAFRTRRGAEFMRKHGRANPHCVTVMQAERLAIAHG
jgi:hypothetical protein